MITNNYTNVHAREIMYPRLHRLHKVTQGLHAQRLVIIMVTQVTHNNVFLGISCRRFWNSAHVITECPIVIHIVRHICPRVRLSYTRPHTRARNTLSLYSTP